MNLDFSVVHNEPIMADSCFYCGVPIRSKHIMITFEQNIKSKMRLHIGPEFECWDNFVLGVKLVNKELGTGRTN